MHSARKERGFFSLPEIWDFCLDKIYNKAKYVGGFMEVMTAHGITTESKILDAGCGSGFPALDLIQHHYDVTATDKSSEMVRQIGINAKGRGLQVAAHHAMWSELERFFGKEKFDFVYCRGNSLVYAVSWEQNWIVPERSQEEIQIALRNFYDILKPGGVLYVDVTSAREKPHVEDIGVIDTSEGDVRLTWQIQRDEEHAIRTWTMQLQYQDRGEIKSYPSYSYLLKADELVGFLTKIGFSKIKSHVKVKGEKNYDVFVARK